MTEMVYLVFVEAPDSSEVVGVFSSLEDAAECENWMKAQIAQTSWADMEKVRIREWVVDGPTRRGNWRVWIDLEGNPDGTASYDHTGSEIPYSYQMKRNDKPCGWAATGETKDDAYVRAREALIAGD